MKHKGSLIFAIVGMLLFAGSIVTVKYLEAEKNKETVQANQEQTESSYVEESSIELEESLIITDESVQEDSSELIESEIIESEVVEEESSEEAVEESSQIEIDLTAPVDFDIEDNIYLDALTYTGYNMQKHWDDGLMWTYVLSAEKAGKGWLSNITYGSGSTGLETTAEGLPDIEHFEMGGFVCASFATYV